MKIINVSVEKKAGYLALTIMPESGQVMEVGAPWVNKRGLWASDAEGRDPHELAAVFRQFADQLDLVADSNGLMVQ